MRTRSALSRSRVITAVLFGLISSCGAESDADRRSDSSNATLLQSQETTSQVRACGVATPTAASLGFNLLAGETYAKDIAPIVMAKCARCHAGDAAMQNSTTCGFLEKNIDAVIVRLQNSLAAEAIRVVEAAKPDTDTTKLNNDQIRNQVSGNDRNKWPMPPVGQQGNNQQRLVQADIDVFTAWKDVPNKCVDTGAVDDPLPMPSHFTDDDEERARLSKIFEGDSCKDGPDSAGDRAVVESMLALPADSTSAFYDYEKKEFVAGAVKMEGNCSIDYFIGALAVVPGAADALKSYQDYGWWATQCAIVDGRPQAYLAHVASVTTSLGDKTYGVFLKLLRVTDP